MDHDANGLRHWGDGIFSLDSGYIRPRFDAIHLVLEAGRCAIIDTATALAAPRVLNALDTLGITRDAVDAVILTHVHLDHAGGAGPLMRTLPAARLYVHPRGARHMADPAKLWAGTCAVYGTERAEALYGAPVAVDPERIVEVAEGDRVGFAGREFECLDTPGHARHHIVLRDATSGHCFTGDTFGISYGEFDVDGRAFVFPSSTPVQFDPQALRTSIRRIADLEPGAVYLTHYAQRRDVPTLASTLLRLVDAYEAIGERARGLAGDARARSLEQAMSELLLFEARRHGCRLDEARMRDLLEGDIALNAAGIGNWLDAG